MNPEERTEGEAGRKPKGSAENIREKIISSARKTTSRETAPAENVQKLTPPVPEAPRRRQGLERGRGLWSILQTNLALAGPNLRDMAMFCRQLSTLLDVGIPLLQSLRILSERTAHPQLRKVVAQLADRVEAGNTLSSALREHPSVFSPLFVSVVEVGELGGILESSVRRLAEILEMKSAIRKKITSSLMYPIAAIIVCLGVVSFIMYWAVPRFAAIYAGFGDAKLPRITQRLMAISDFLRHYPALYIPLIAIVVVGLFLYRKTPSGKAMFDFLALKTYIIGRINTKINVARFTRSLGSLVAAGIPLLEALKVSARTAENTLIARKLQQVHDSLEKGGRMEDPLREDETIPPMVVDMMAIGYEAGAVEDMLLKIADTYDADVDDTLKGLASIIEPVLIVILGMVVLFVALALVVPYFNLVHVVR